MLRGPTKLGGKLVGPFWPSPVMAGKTRADSKAMERWGWLELSDSQSRELSSTHISGRFFLTWLLRGLRTFAKPSSISKADAASQVYVRNMNLPKAYYVFVSRSFVYWRCELMFVYHIEVSLILQQRSPL